MTLINSAREARMPFSLSRWTDVPAAKWEWWKEQLAQGEMIAFDPMAAGAPKHWSLKPEDTLGLVFWTKDPTNLIHDAPWLGDYNFRIHVTLTGWEEVEKGAPNLVTGANLLARTTEAYGPGRVTWRFSPVPIVSDTVGRFQRIARIVGPAGVDRVFLSFLQENDLMPETRSELERVQLMKQLADIGALYGIKVFLCNEDESLVGRGEYQNLSAGVCAPPTDFDQPGRQKPPSEGCGCIHMLDPFTLNESCTMGCKYCYASDKNYAPKKINTTRSLPVIR